MTLTLRRFYFGAKSVKSMYFFKNKNFFSTSEHRKNEYIVIIIKKGDTKIVNFTTPWAVVPCARAWYS